MRIASVLALCGVLLGAACGDDDVGPALCDGDVTATFGAVPAEEVHDFSLGGIDFSSLEGDVVGLRWEGTPTLLLWNAELEIVPPCAAAEVELVIEQTQVGVWLELYADDGPDPVLSVHSEAVADLVPEEGTFERWTVSDPAGARITRIRLDNVGSSPVPPAEGVSTLVKSVTFR